MAAAVSPAAIRTAREKAGITQHQLARMVGVAGGERVSRWERGTSEPRPDILVRVARALGCPAVDLLVIRGDEPDLRALRFSAGTSANELAIRLHVSKSTYLRWEAGRGERMPSRQQIRDLAKALNVSAAVATSALEHARTGAFGRT